MKNKSYLFLFYAVIAVMPWLSETSRACTVGEEMQTQLPFNAIDISNADRLAIADIFTEAKKWPDVKIQAVVIAGAYKGENNLDRLKDARAESVKAYLQQLGINQENIIIEKKTFTDDMVTKTHSGSVTVHQIVVELTPICEGGCARLCDDPRVRPTSKVIQ